MRLPLSIVLPGLLGVVLASTGIAMAAKRVPGPGRMVVSMTARPAAEAARLNEGLFDPADGLFKRGPKDERTLALTFDDGPHPESAERLLDVLKQLDVKATFFVVGERVKARPDIVRRMLAEGHEVGNHTEDHLRLHELSGPKIEQELRGCEEAVRKATGHSMVLMRPPGMRFTPKVLQVARELGYITVDVNNVAGDYVPNGGVSDLTPEEADAYGLTPDVIVERVEKQLKGGTILLLHDNPITLQAVPIIVEHARAQGYRFVTTADMLASLPSPVKIVANPSIDKR